MRGLPSRSRRFGLFPKGIAGAPPHAAAQGGSSLCGLRSRLFRQANQYFPQVAGAGDPLRKVEPQRLGAGLEVNAVRVDPAATPISGLGPQKPCGIESQRFLMVGIHVFDRALFGFQERARIRDIGQKLRGLEVQNSSNSRNQMASAGTDSEEREILEV